MKTYALSSQGCCGSGHMNIRLKELGLKRVAQDGVENYHNPHTRYPAKTFEGRVLFMYGDPRNILLSSIGQSDNDSWIISHCTYLDGDCDYFGYLLTWGYLSNKWWKWK